MSDCLKSAPCVLDGEEITFSDLLVELNKETIALRNS